jgi:hypothetical protein
MGFIQQAVLRAYVVGPAGLRPGERLTRERAPDEGALMHEVGLGLAQRWRALADRFGNRLVGANALLLMIASWTPGSVVVRSGIFSGHVEHAAAYALSGALIYALRAGRSTAWAAALLLSAYAGALELGQIFVPGRHAGFDDFVFSVTGAITGILVSAALLKQAQVGGK